ncbi:MAG: hypothetical protein P8M12_01060 [Flavobacteriales bacterium]|nr:hypothetical protein [Flavobacteriales bacterium]
MAIEININKRNQVNTPLGVLSKIADNIYLLDYEDELEITVEKSVGFRDKLIALVKNEKIGIILNAMDIQGTASIGSMQFFSKDIKYNNVCVAQAIITNKLAHKLLANFYADFINNKSKVKLFNNYTEGLTWIETEIKSELKS